MLIRASVESDLGFLEEMLLEAFFWDPSAPRPPLASVRAQSEFSMLLAGWGRPGDRALVADENGARVGAAWFRLWTPEIHSYGFVESDIPELGLAVDPKHRSKGIGRGLLHALIDVARADGFPGLSLSVSPFNRARGLYESEGFRKTGESGTSWTMLLSFDG